MAARNHITYLVNDGAGVAEAEVKTDKKAKAEVGAETPKNASDVLEQNVIGPKTASKGEVVPQKSPDKKGDKNG